MQAPYFIESEIWLLDSPIQRDALYPAYVELVMSSAPKDCIGSSLADPVKVINSASLGKRRLAFTQKSVFGDGVGSLVAVGDRMLLKVGFAHIGPGSKKSVDLKTAEAITVAIVHDAETKIP